MTRRVKPNHLGKPVTYPSGYGPGEPIQWNEHGEPGHCAPPNAWSGAEPDRVRGGVVIDRAANGYADGGEEGGWWLWVMPDDAGEPVRVRVFTRGRAKGTVARDDGPMYAPSIVGRDRVIAYGHTYDEWDWRRRRSRARCLCCDETTTEVG